MSLIDPPIDELLEKCDGDKFLLCAVASKRAHDITDMMHSQQERAAALQQGSQVSELTGRKALSLAMSEIAADDISFGPDTLHIPQNNEELEAEYKAAEAL
ncbi:MAG: DNA-directed RNA polymerase subunit omega [Coriobacteriales bacterium]|jgi:DNA-directed RNA polymerase subunit omega|nr:DNA-directed RNA polymerase subunit omega [Coriobacteriales bacterium]